MLEIDSIFSETLNILLTEVSVRSKKGCSKRHKMKNSPQLTLDADNNAWLEGHQI